MLPAKFILEAQHSPVFLTHSISMCIFTFLFIQSLWPIFFLHTWHSSPGHRNLHILTLWFHAVHCSPIPRTLKKCKLFKYKHSYIIFIYLLSHWHHLKIPTWVSLTINCSSNEHHFREKCEAIGLKYYLSSDNILLGAFDKSLLNFEFHTYHTGWWSG